MTIWIGSTIMIPRFPRRSSSGDPNRRSFLQAMALSAGSLACAVHSGISHAEEKEPLGLIPREKDPENLEFPFASLDSFLTPNKLFYVRNHFAAPKLDAETWRLKVEGA